MKKLNEFQKISNIVNKALTSHEVGKFSKDKNAVIDSSESWIYYVNHCNIAEAVQEYAISKLNGLEIEIIKLKHVWEKHGMSAPFLDILEKLEEIKDDVRKRKCEIFADSENEEIMRIQKEAKENIGL